MGEREKEKGVESAYPTFQAVRRRELPEERAVVLMKSLWTLYFLMLLALIVWIGGIIFFAFVLAPTLFSVLPTTKLAGDVVNVALTKLHWMGLVSGIVFLICSLTYNRLKYAQLKLFAAAQIFIVVMLALTAISQFGITPRLRLVRSQLELAQRPDYIPYIPGSTPALIARSSEQFDSLHAWSTRIEGGVLLLGLGVVILTARRFEPGS